LFKEIMAKRMTVRDAEAIARRIAYDKVRKPDSMVSPEIIEIEEKLTEKFGTRVKVDRKENGGKVTIDFFNTEDLRKILDLMGDNVVVGGLPPIPNEVEAELGQSPSFPEDVTTTPEPEQENTDDLYFIKNFSV